MDINRESLERCVNDINTWMQGMTLKLNHFQTEYILIGTPQQLAKCTNMAINIGGNKTHTLNCVRNLGAYFSKHMTMEQHVKFKCRADCAQLYNFGKVRIYLDHQSPEKLIQAFLIGLPKYLIQKLQTVQNTAARVLCRIGKYYHITSTLKSFHWLTVAFRIKYKICLMMFNSLHSHMNQHI